ncbi:ABC transporter permease [Marinicella rhabdoformis]|uniref:ABC transporter permease n=1 Tax=Marinicella rhabdoformis TaxID=2580566 RepID=UPI0012AEDAC0|nr:ABC transporter permease [Marinicella rhabdoformis]
MSRSAFSTVYWKEVFENLRDKRTMMSSVLMGSVMGPLLMVGLMNMTVKMQKDKSEKPLELPVVAMEHAQSMKTFLLSQGVELIEIDKSPEQVIKDKDHDVVLEIDEGFAEAVSNGEPAKVMLYYDDSAKGAAKVTVRRARALVNGYSRGIGNMRLQLRGIPQSLTQVIYIEDHDLSTKTSRGAQFLSFLPYFLIIGLFAGSMYLAIDTTAGEKERKSMEPLFLNPVSRSAILSGKLAATVSFGLLTLVLTVLAFKLTLPWYPFEKLGMSFDLDIMSMALMFLVLAPLALLAGSIQTIIAAFAKTFREAQTYVGLLIMIPMIPSMMLMFLPVKEKLWMMAIPILNQNLIINQMIRGEVVGWDAILVTIFSTLLLGLILAWVAVQLYNREKMLFSD